MNKVLLYQLFPLHAAISTSVASGVLQHQLVLILQSLGKNTKASMQMLERLITTGWCRVKRKARVQYTYRTSSESSLNLSPVPVVHLPIQDTINVICV